MVPKQGPTSHKHGRVRRSSEDAKPAVITRESSGFGRLLVRPYIFQKGKTIVALADVLKELDTARPATFDQWLKIASDEDRNVVLEYIGNPMIPLDSLVKTLRANGVPITRETVEKYRVAR